GRQTAQPVFTHWLIDLDQRNGIFADLLAAQVKPADVDLMVADKRGDSPKNSRLVAVEKQQHVAFRQGGKAESIDSDDARVTASKEGAGDFTFAFGGHPMHFNHAGEVSRFART